jgi:hypothetical protein
VWGSRGVRVAGLLQHPFPPDPNTCSRGRNASHHRRHYRGQRSRESDVSWPWAIRDCSSCREWAPAALWVQCLAPCRPWVAPTVSAVTDSPSAARGTMPCIFRTERAPDIGGKQCLDSADRCSTVRRACVHCNADSPSSLPPQVLADATHRTRRCRAVVFERANTQQVEVIRFRVSLTNTGIECKQHVSGVIDVARTFTGCLLLPRPYHFFIVHANRHTLTRARKRLKT